MTRDHNTPRGGKSRCQRGQLASRPIGAETASSSTSAPASEPPAAHAHALHDGQPVARPPRDPARADLRLDEHELRGRLVVEDLDAPRARAAARPGRG